MRARLRLGDDSVPAPLIASREFDEAAFAVSPDERWIAYESNEGTARRTEVYIRPFPNVDAGKWQVSIDGGQAPLWAPNGRELFHVSRNREMMVATVANGATPELGPRQRLFRLAPDIYLTELERYTPFDITRDGQRFIMARQLPRDPRDIAPLTVTENWFDELQRILARR
jgi:hypothetical protein